MSKPQNLKGFSFMELLIAIGIIAILIAIAGFGLSVMQRNSRDSRRTEVANELKRGIESYYSEFGNYPNTDTFVHDEKGQLVICYDVNCTRVFNLEVTEEYLNPSLSPSSNQETRYCYSRQPNGSYILGIQKESGTWIDIGTNTTVNCTNYPNQPPVIFIEEQGGVIIPPVTQTPTPTSTSSGEITPSATPTPTSTSSGGINPSATPTPTSTSSGGINP